jgi:hypothetical protein
LARHSGRTDVAAGDRLIGAAAYARLEGAAAFPGVRIELSGDERCLAVSQEADHGLVQMPADQVMLATVLCPSLAPNHRAMDGWLPASEPSRSRSSETSAAIASSTGASHATGRARVRHAQAWTTVRTDEFPRMDLVSVHGQLPVVYLADDGDDGPCAAGSR